MSSVGKYSDSGFGHCSEGLAFKDMDSKYAESGPTYKYHLTRQEIVSLFNAFGRLCIKEMENFRNLLQNIH